MPRSSISPILSINLRYIAKTIYTYFLFVFVGFIALFVILDFISEAKEVSEQYHYAWVIGQVLLRTIYYLYQFIPIAALIACVLAVVKLAQQSEFVIMRMHGLSLYKILKIFTIISIPLIIFTFILGEYLVPLSERLSLRIKQQVLQKNTQELKTGLWLKYQKPINPLINQNISYNNISYIIRIRQSNIKMSDDFIKKELTILKKPASAYQFFADVHVYEFLNNNVNNKENKEAQEPQEAPTKKLQKIYTAKYASIDGQARQFLLHSVKEISILNTNINPTINPAINIGKNPSENNTINNINNTTNTIITNKPNIDLNIYLPSAFTEYIGLKNKAQSMSIQQIKEYIKFLEFNQQNTYDYRLSLWQKYCYPFSNLLMLWLGAVFIYFKQRQPKHGYTFGVIVLGLLMYLGQTILLQIAQFKVWPVVLVNFTPLLIGAFLMLGLHLYLQRK